MSGRRVTVLWVVALLMVSAGIAVLGTREPAPEAAIPTIDDPIVRRTPTDAPPVAPVVAAPDRGGPPAPAAPGVPPCVPQALQIDVVPTKARFSAGETVEGMFFVQTSGATNCAVAMPTSFRIENVATGEVLGSTPAVTEVPTRSLPTAGRTPARSPGSPGTARARRAARSRWRCTRRWRNGPGAARTGAGESFASADDNHTLRS